MVEITTKSVDHVYRADHKSGLLIQVSRVDLSRQTWDASDVCFAPRMGLAATIYDTAERHSAKGVSQRAFIRIHRR